MKINKILVILAFFFLMLVNVQALEEGDPYLEEILIDDKLIEGFQSDKFDYQITFPSDKENVKIVFKAGRGFTTSSNGISVNNPTVTLKSGENKYTIVASTTDSTKKTEYHLTLVKEDSRSNNNYLSSLTVADKNVKLEKDKNDYEVQVDNSVSKVTVKATIDALNAKFVDGYGERLDNNPVTLSGERTDVELRIQAENGEIRTYKISIVKSNYKSNDATLKSLTIKELPFNFTGTIYEYNLEVNNEVEKINIEAIPNNDKAKVDYKKTATLKEGVNNLVVSVEAEDGSKKEYKINITRHEAEALVKNIAIEEIIFKFDPDVYDYEIKTTADKLNFKVSLTKTTATSKILNNKNLVNGSIIKVQAVDGDKTVTYNFKIVKAKTVIASSNPIEIDKNDSNENFFRKYEMYIALGTLGIGILGTLIALLTRPKKDTANPDSQIM